MTAISKEHTMRGGILVGMLVCLVTLAARTAGADTLEYITDNQVRSPWQDQQAGVLANDFENAYEGTRSIRFNYTMTRDPSDPQHPNGWAGFGFWHYTPLDFTHYNYMSMAIQGPTSDNAALWLAICTKASADTADTVYYYSLYEVAGPYSSTEWVVVNAPLDSFVPPLNKAIVIQVDFHLEPRSGISTDTGTFYLDNVLFTSEPVHVSRRAPGGRLLKGASSHRAGPGDIRVEVYALNGARMRRGAVRDAAFAGDLGASPFCRTLPRGVYLAQLPDPAGDGARFFVRR
jgi:hypothetical protein